MSEETKLANGWKCSYIYVGIYHNCDTRVSTSLASYIVIYLLFSFFFFGTFSLVVMSIRFLIVDGRE